METLNPRCVGTTARTFSDPTKDINLDQESDESKTVDYANRGNFNNAQFSSDGTTIITQNGPKTLRTFILPPNLLDGSDEPHALVSHVFLSSASTIQAYSIQPHYKLQDPSTTLVLSSSSDLPITLSNALHTDSTCAKYPFVNPTTEAYIAPSSLLWTGDGTHFVAGSSNKLAIFDASYPGSGPVLTHKTALGRREARVKGADPNRRCKGTITALSTNSDGILAAGTRERNLALYAQEGSGECITSFSLSSLHDPQSMAKGTGITLLSWDPSGTYLLVTERQSEVISVFDMRNTYSRVAWLSGRKAMTFQKLGMDVVPTAKGYEVWASGTDGCVRMWKNPGAAEGEQAPDGVLEVHAGPVSNAIWHPAGAVLATCSGARDQSWQWADSSDESGGEGADAGASPDDNSLKIWTV